MPDQSQPPADGQQLATLGAGCFWCVEAVLEQLDGVESVDSGYMGGDIPDPTYEQVCSGRSGHAEVVQVRFDPERIPYEHLLEWFWKLHDPTTLNRQGNDVGTQYRSAIFPASPEQEAEARAAIERAQAESAKPIVTTIEPMSEWYTAEGYHQDYWETSGRSNPYCMAVIPPKLQKLRKSFAARSKAQTVSA